MPIAREYIAETIQEVRMLVNDPTAFERLAVSVQESFGENMQLRLCKWLRFFTDNYAHCVCLYSASIFALIEGFGTNGLFLAQTEHERETSLSFYANLFDTKVFLYTRDEKVAKHLLAIALVYGRYPGMQIRPIRHAADILACRGLNEHSLHKVFECLFIKYENPKFITHNLTSLQPVEVDALMFALQGNNIRNYSELPVSISKKTSFLLVNKVPEMPFESDVLKRGVAAAQLAKVDQSPQLLNEFVRGCRTFNTNIDLFLQDINFWQQAYRILAAIMAHEQALNLSVQEFIDYFEHQKYHAAEESYSLKGRTVLSVARAIHEWHGNLAKYTQESDLKRVWKGLDGTAEKYKLQDGNDRYVFKEITTGTDLAKESERMEHCVFSYLPDCVSGYCSIWSMKKASGDMWAKKHNLPYYFGSHVTIEVVGRSIVQVAGKRNAPPTSKDWRIIKKWAKMAGFSIDWAC